MRRSNGEHGPVLSIPERIQRAKDYARAYCELGKAKLVGARFGVSEQWVRWVLLDGHKRGWCRYSPKDRSCKLVGALPEVISTATSWAEASRRFGYRSGAPFAYVVKQLSLDAQIINRQFAANRTQMFLDRLMTHAERLGVRHSLNTTVLQADKPARAALMRVQGRTGWSIDEIRKQVGILV